MQLMNKMNQRVVFVVDGNKKIGLGHVYRTLNLAKELKKSVNNIIFLTNDSMAMQLIKPNFHCMFFPKMYSLTKASIITKNDVVIIDKLHESYKKLHFIKSNSFMMIGIDYIGKNKKLFSKGINILYQKTGISGSNVYSGFKYTILNQNFTKTKPIKIKKKPKSLVIMQGGTDSHCFIPSIVNSISSSIRDMNVTVIAGRDFRGDKKLKQIAQKNAMSLTIKKNLKNMSQELIKHDIAITGGGVTLLELCRLGIPSVVICTEKFENETASVLQHGGFGINLGYYAKVSRNDVVTTINALFDNRKLRSKMNKNGRKIIDGCGSKRVSGLIREWVRANEHFGSSSTS